MGRSELEKTIKIRYVESEKRYECTDYYAKIPDVAEDGTYFIIIGKTTNSKASSVYIKELDVKMSSNPSYGVVYIRFYKSINLINIKLFEFKENTIEQIGVKISRVLNEFIKCMECFNQYDKMITILDDQNRYLREKNELLKEEVNMLKLSHLV